MLSHRLHYCSIVLYSIDFINNFPIGFFNRFIYMFSTQNLRFKKNNTFPPLPPPPRFFPVSHMVYRWIVAVHCPILPKIVMVFFLFSRGIRRLVENYGFNYGLYIYIYFRNMDFYSNQISPENYYRYSVT